MLEASDLLMVKTEKEILIGEPREAPPDADVIKLVLINFGGERDVPLEDIKAVFPSPQRRT